MEENRRVNHEGMKSTIKSLGCNSRIELGPPLPGSHPYVALVIAWTSQHLSGLATRRRMINSQLKLANDNSPIRE